MTWLHAAWFWLRDIARGSPLQSLANLIVPATVGGAALFVLLVMPIDIYNNFPPLLAKTKVNEDGSSERNIAVLVQPVEGGVAAWDLSGRTIATQHRLAVNLLTRSGYLHSATATTFTEPETSTLYRLNTEKNARDCVQLPDAGVSATGEKDGDASVADEAWKLALVAVAVEKYHRNSLQRELEWTYVRLATMLAGRTPDLSLGVAQIRLSTLRRIAREADLANGRYSALRVSEATLVASLHNECASLKLAAVVMYHYLKHPVGPACDIDDESCSPADAAAAAFNGSPKPNGAIVAYGPVVRAGADMLHDDQGP